MKRWRPGLLPLLLPIFSLAILADFGCRGSTSEEPSAGDERRGAAAVDDAAESAVEADPLALDRASDAPQSAERDPPGPPVDGVDKLPHLRGRSQDGVIEELGPPTSKQELRMGDCCSEFEIELYNTYPPNSGHEAVVIQQWTWAYDGYAVTLWFHLVAGTWTVLETSRYSDDVEF